MKAAAFEPGARPSGGIPLCVPEIGGNEWTYVRDCLDTGWVSSVGTYVTRFEEAIAAVSGSKHAVATVNGTAALHIALLCAGVERDDEVLVPALTFIAPVNAIRYLGAHPVLIDAEPTYWQMDVREVERFLERNCSWDGAVLRNTTTGRRVKAILPVDVLGHPVEFEPLVDLARAYALPIVEDATESLGARCNDVPCGKRALVACFSFNGNKLITTGGGGMLVTDDAELAARARYLTTQAKDDPIEYVHGDVGYNYRLSNVAAAIGVAQVEQLENYAAIKRTNAATYAKLLSDVRGVTPMREAPWAFSTFWLFTILVSEVEFGRSSRGLLGRLGDAGIQARPLWQPMHRSPSLRGEAAFAAPVADAIYRDALSLPSSVGLTPSEIERVVAAVRAAAAT